MASAVPHSAVPRPAVSRPAVRPLAAKPASAISKKTPAPAAELGVSIAHFRLVEALPGVEHWKFQVVVLDYGTNPYAISNIERYGHLTFTCKRPRTPGPALMRREWFSGLTAWRYFYDEEEACPFMSHLHSCVSKRVRSKQPVVFMQGPGRVRPGNERGSF